MISTVEPQKILQTYWAKEYEESDSWADFWRIVHDPAQETWPSDLTVAKEKIYWQGRLRVPESLVDHVALGHHVNSVHISVKKLIKNYG